MTLLRNTLMVLVIMGIIGAAASAAPATVSANLPRSNLGCVDVNNNGLIDTPELFDVIDEYFEPPLDSSLMCVDTNGNGMVDTSELFDVIDAYFEPPASLRHQAALQENRELMLDLINEERENVGIPPIQLGNNTAAQSFAQESLDGCWSGHWGADGSIPAFRYSQAGGHQANAENASGLDYCITSSDGFGTINPTNQVYKAMKGLMNSPGHRRQIINLHFTAVNIGIAWNDYNFHVVQQFETSYAHFDNPPSIQNGTLSLKGNLINRATQARSIQIFHHHPLAPLTRGQLTSTYCMDPGLIIVTISPPPPSGYSYRETEFTSTYNRCLTPFDFPPDTPAPQSYEEAIEFHQRASETSSYSATVTYPLIVADTWNMSATSFDITADLSEVIRTHGPGIYRIVTRAYVAGRSTVIGETAISYP